MDNLPDAAVEWRRLRLDASKLDSGHVAAEAIAIGFQLKTRRCEVVDCGFHLALEEMVEQLQHQPN